MRTQFDLIDYLVIEANSACNLACVSCNRKELERQGLRKPKVLSRVDLETILRMFESCPIRTIKFEWLSEPMLHPEFDVLCSMVRSRFPEAHIIIATNLQYNVEKTPLARALPFVDTVYLSIDGVGATYEKLRIGAKWDKLLRSLKTLSETIPEDTRASKLHINFTLCRDNIDDIEAIYALKNSYGLASVRINFAQNWNEHEVTRLEYSNEEIAKVRRYAADLKGVPGWKYESCFWPFHGITVDVHGDVRQCIINTSQQPIGNVFTDDVRSLFNSSPVYLEARRALNRGCPPAQCKTCDYHHLSPLLSRVFGESPAPQAHEKVVAPEISP